MSGSGPVDGAEPGAVAGRRRPGRSRLWHVLRVVVVLVAVICVVAWLNHRADNIDEREVTCTVTDIVKEKPKRSGRYNISRPKNIVVTQECGKLERTPGLVSVRVGEAYTFTITGHAGTVWTKYPIIRSKTPNIPQFPDMLGTSRP